MAGDLSVTALYTSQVWVWGNLPNADLFATRDAKRVFDATNAALAVGGIFGSQQWAPLRVALLHRHLIIDHLVGEARPVRVIELAAGLSRRGATVSADPKVHYVEIDLPEMVENKRALLEKTAAGRGVLARENFELVAGDVAKIELDRFVVPGQPVFVIAEGLLMYLDGYARRTLFGKLGGLAQLTGEVAFAFDLVPSQEEVAAGRVGRLLESAMKLFTNGRTFERDAKSREQVREELATAGFSESSAISAYDVATEWKLPHARTPANMVVFSGRAVPASRG